MRLAFAYFDWSVWTAGTTFFRSLFASLRQANSSERQEILLLVPPDQAPSSYAPLCEFIDDVIEAPATPGELSMLLKQYNVDVLTSNAQYGEAFSTPLIAWIPDFQHVHMPQMFSVDELLIRQNEFQRMAKYATLVMVTSTDVKNHFAEFSPDQAHKARLIHFRAQIPATFRSLSPDKVALKYNLPEKFIYLPNQFWKHKNHQLVIESLEIARKRNPEVTVVCSGHTRDYRHPEYFHDILLEVSCRNVRENFIILGLLPSHEEVFALMRKSLIVLQPSLFEGLGMGLAEAKTLNKRVILSDIPVFRELGPDNAIYFNPHNAQDLANKLLECYESFSFETDRPLEPITREDNDMGSAQMAKSFLQIAKEASTQVNTLAQRS